jgi:hypothetical protein
MVLVCGVLLYTTGGICGVVAGRVGGGWGCGLVARLYHALQLEHDVVSQSIFPLICRAPAGAPLMRQHICRVYVGAYVANMA